MPISVVWFSENCYIESILFCLQPFQGLGYWNGSFIVNKTGVLIEFSRHITLQLMQNTVKNTKLKYWQLYSETIEIYQLVSRIKFRII